MGQVKFFKGCLPQILFGPFLVHTWIQMRLNSYSKQENVEIIKKLKQRKERNKWHRSYKLQLNKPLIVSFEKFPHFALAPLLLTSMGFRIVGE